jgi:hypothetical protein
MQITDVLTFTTSTRTFATQETCIRKVYEFIPEEIRSQLHWVFVSKDGRLAPVFFIRNGHEAVDVNALAIARHGWFICN